MMPYPDLGCDFFICRKRNQKSIIQICQEVKILKNLRAITDALSNIGINIESERFAEQEEIFSMVLKQLAGKWDELTKTQRYYIQRAIIGTIQETYNKDYKSLFGDVALDWDESVRFFDCINSPQDIRNPADYLTSVKYAISNKGRVISITRGKCKELAQSDATHGYKQVCLQQENGKHIYMRVHKLVAYVWCENGKYKKETHHIDGNITNNDASNLIHLTTEEHDKADKLLRAAKKNDDFREYKKFILAMQKDNKIEVELALILIEDASGYYHAVYLPKKIKDELMTGVRTLDDIYTDETLAHFLLIEESA